MSGLGFSCLDWDSGAWIDISSVWVDILGAWIHISDVWVDISGVGIQISGQWIYIAGPCLGVPRADCRPHGMSLAFGVCGDSQLSVCA